MSEGTTKHPEHLWPDAAQGNAVKTDAVFEANGGTFDRDEIEGELEAVDDDGFGTGEQEKIVMRYVRLRNTIEAEIGRVKAQLEGWIKTQENRIKGLDYVYQGHAESYLRKMLAGKKKGKSVKLPFGTIGFRAVADLLQVKDEDVLKAEAANPDAPIELKKCIVKTEITKVVKSDLDAFFKSSGMVPAGCELRPGGEKFFVK